MARYQGSNFSEDPIISDEKIKNFFNERAKKIEILDELRAVMYQDDKPNLVIERDKVEKAKILPHLKIYETSNIIDIGCGTGRWLKSLKNKFNSYYGIDISSGFIDYLNEKYKDNFKVDFEELSVNDLRVDRNFDRLLCMGLLIYINDSDLVNFLVKLNCIMDEKSVMVFREPVGINYRLTLDGEFSDDLNSEYSAIYRTKDEIIEFFKKYLTKFKIKKIEPLFDSDLNNRMETQQFYFILGN